MKKNTRTASNQSAEEAVVDYGASGELGVNVLNSVLEGVVLELERRREDVTRINANDTAIGESGDLTALALNLAAVECKQGTAHAWVQELVRRGLLEERSRDSA